MGLETRKGEGIKNRNTEWRTDSLFPQRLSFSFCLYSCKSSGRTRTCRSLITFLFWSMPCIHSILFSPKEIIFTDRLLSLYCTALATLPALRPAEPTKHAHCTRKHTHRYESHMPQNTRTNLTLCHTGLINIASRPCPSTSSNRPLARPSTSSRASSSQEKGSLVRRARSPCRPRRR